MKAAILYGNEDLRYSQTETPVPGANEVRIKVAMCGICGSDIPRVFNNGARKYPIILGHEFSGVVDAVGEGADGFTVGEKVTAAPLLPCGECVDCKNGNYSLCAHYGFTGSRNNGAMAEYVVVPKENVVKVDNDISFEDAATIEPATVGAHALKLVGYKPGKSVAVIGCGIIGLFTLQFAKLKGAKDVTVISRGEEGLNLAKELGADHIISTAGRSREDVTGDFKEGGYDYVFDCSGNNEVMLLPFSAVSNKGTICYVGTPKKEMVIPVKIWELINRKECFVTGSWMSYSAPFPGDEWTDVIKYMKSGEIKAIPGMISEILPMSEAYEAFKMVRDRKAKGRVLLKNDI